MQWDADSKDAHTLAGREEDASPHVATFLALKYDTAHSFYLLLLLLSALLLFSSHTLSGSRCLQSLSLQSLSESLFTDARY